jgi:hypothetical protein
VREQRSIEQAYEEDGQALVEQHGHNEDREQRHNASGAQHKSRDTQLHTMDYNGDTLAPDSTASETSSTATTVCRDTLTHILSKHTHIHTAAAPDGHVHKMNTDT